jgi:sugar (pentulose or hexulose) kinase
MRFAAIDLGASFIKSALLDTASCTISHIERVPFPPFTENLPSGYREVSVEQALRITKEQIDRLLTVAPDCAGIVSCGQMHGLVLTDGHGDPLTDFISWMDERTLLPNPAKRGSYLETLVSTVASHNGTDLIHEMTAGSTIAILFWLAATQGIPKGAVPRSLPDFVMSQLSKSEAQCEPTMASGFGVFDALKGAWRAELIETLGLGHLRWPKITPYCDAIGSYRAGTNHIPLYAPLGDQQCALLGALLNAGELSVNVATGSQVSMVKDRCERGEYHIRPYFDGRFLHTVTHLPAGRALNQLVDLLTELARSQGHSLNDPWRYIEEASAGVASTDLRVDLPLYAGWPRTGGGIFNIRGANVTVGHLFRAAFERMAETYYAAALKLDPHATWRNLVFSGGLITKSTLLQQLIQNKFGLGARMSPSQEDTLFGLLVLSMTLSGQSTTLLQAMEACGGAVASAIEDPRIRAR